MTTDLISRARAGDGEAFRELTEPHHRELQVHCYRMLGSFADAEDALQDTLLAAWQGLAGFEGGVMVLDARCERARGAGGSGNRVNRSEGWEILAERLTFEGAIGAPPGPEVRYEQAESISLAFVTALQVLPPRQLAVLILRDVLGFRASEVADMLEVTVESVTSALKRARASLQRSRSAKAGREPSPVPGSPAEDAVVARFVRAYESADLDALVALLTDDVFMSMPPIPLEYQGRDAVARFCAILLGSGRAYSLVPARANGQPAFGAYVRGPGGIRHGTGLFVLTLAGDRICALTRFESSVLAWFGLPRSLPPSAA